MLMSVKFGINELKAMRDFIKILNNNNMKYNWYTKIINGIAYKIVEAE